LLWVQEHAAGWGGKKHEITLAGESAGGNLVTALAVASAYEQNETWAKPLWRANIELKAVIALYGYLQITNAKRFLEKHKMSIWIKDRILEVPAEYLPTGIATKPGVFPLADPLLILESEQHPQRNLPPFWIAAGTSDPIHDDSVRLQQALGHLKVVHEFKSYKRELHGFNNFVWKKNARQSWRDLHVFLKQQNIVTSR